MSKEYARARWGLMSQDRNDAAVRPGDPYPFQGAVNPFGDLLSRWSTTGPRADSLVRRGSGNDNGNFLTAEDPEDAEGTRRDADAAFYDAFTRGTTSIQAADENGWLVSITPSGGWNPAVIAGSVASFKVKVPTGEGDWNPKYEALDFAKNPTSGTLSSARSM